MVKHITEIVWYDKTIETSKPNSKGEQNMSENKETKQEVTNEQILEHLKEIEIAQGCIANSINTLFSFMSERKEQLRLSGEEVETIKYGQIALACLVESMADISGMNKRVQKAQEEKVKEDVQEFLDFLKEIF